MITQISCLHPINKVYRIKNKNNNSVTYNSINSNIVYKFNKFNMNFCGNNVFTDSNNKQVEILKQIIDEIPEKGDKKELSKKELDTFTLFFENIKLSKKNNKTYIVHNKNGDFELITKTDDDNIYYQPLSLRKTFGHDVHFFEDKYRYIDYNEKELVETNERYLRTTKPKFVNSSEGDLSRLNFNIPTVKDRPLKIAFIAFDPRGEDKVSFSVGVNYLEGALKDKFKNDVDILNLDDQIDSISDIKEKLDEFKPDLIGVSSKIHTYHKSSPFIEYCHEKFPESLLLVGGTTASYGYKEILDDHPYATVCVQNGEKNINAIADILLGNSEKENIFFAPNIAIKQNDGKIIVAKEVKDDLNIAPTDTNLDDILRKNGIVYLRMSQGCWGHCTFCTQNGGWNSADLDQTISIMENWKKNHKLKSIIFTDDEMVPKDPEESYKRVETFCNKLIERDLGINWYMNLRADSINFFEGEKGDKLIELLKKSNCAGFFIGIESGSQSQLKRYAKEVLPAKTNPKINSDIIKRLNDNGIPVSTGFIMTDPLMPTMNELKENLQFFNDNDLFSMQSRLNNSMRVNRGTSYVRMLGNMDLNLLGPLQPNLLTYDSSYLDPRVGVIRDSIDVSIEEIRPTFELVYNAILRSKLNPDDSKQKILKSHERDMKEITYNYMRDMVNLFEVTPEDKLIDKLGMKQFDNEFWKKRRKKLTNEVQDKIPDLIKLRTKYDEIMQNKINSIEPYLIKN